MPELEHVIGAISDLDGSYLEYQIWPRELTAEQIEEGLICQAFDENDMEIGKLAIDGAGKILIVEVAPDYRRQAIATKMLNELRAADYRVLQDWENMRDGAVWARAVD
jgi:ribosomal protein S18 acetylase RimI-like enzyme